MKAWENYITSVQRIFLNSYDTQKDNMLQAAEIMAECTKQGGVIYIFGTGHTHIVGDDVSCREGVLANVHNIYEPSLSSMVEITKASYMEKISGYGDFLVNYHKISPPDMVVVISNSGNNAVTIDFALECRKKGVKVVVLTSVEYSRGLKPLHSTGKKLMDCADIVLDNCTPFGDCTVSIDGFEQKTGAASTSAFCIMLSAVLAQTVENLIAQGFYPDIYKSNVLAAYDSEIKEHNERIIEKYFYRIKNL